MISSFSLPIPYFSFLAFHHQLTQPGIAFGNAVLKSNAGSGVKNIVSDLLHLSDRERLDSRIACRQRNDIRVTVFQDLTDGRRMKVADSVGKKYTA